jgi:ubiquinol-cytochrome c reductase cytochrome b subunit
MPGVDVTVAGRTVIPNPFWGGVLFPSIVFGSLFLWPAVERRLSGDRSRHNLLDRPRDSPWRTAVAAALLAWVFVIFVAGSADRAYILFGWSYQAQLQIYRVLAVVLPIAALLVTRRVCIELLQNEEVIRRRHEAEAEARAGEARG